MKYIRILLYIFISIITLKFDVYALTCSNSETKDLNTIASHVKASYELIDNSEKKEVKYGDKSKTFIEPNFTFEITIYNITKEIYVKVEDDVSKETTTINYTDTTNGNYVIKNNDFGRIYKYTITIMSASSNCYGKKIRAFNLVKPKYNAYSEYTYCENSSNYYCQKFTTKELNIKDDDDFLNKIRANNNTEIPTTTAKTKEPLINDKNKIIYIGAFFAVAIISILSIIIFKKKNAKKEWKL